MKIRKYRFREIVIRENIKSKNLQIIIPVSTATLPSNQ